MRSILILNARRRVFLVDKMRKYISENNIDIKILTSDSNDLDPIRFFSDGFRILPQSCDSSFLSALENYINDENIIGLMVWNDSDFSFIEKLSSKIKAMGVKLLIPRKEVIDICNDKRKTYDFISDLNLLTPKIHNFKDFSYFNNNVFPLFIKPYDGSGSMWCYKVDNKVFLEYIYYKVPNPLIQDFIEGRMYTVDAFCDYNYEPICVIPRIRLKVRDSEALIAKIDMDSSIISLSKIIISRLKIIGPLNLQFIKTKDGDNYLIEINPRISGGIDLSIAGSAPFHVWILQYFLGQEFIPVKDIKNNLIMTRYYSSIFFQDIMDIGGINESE